MKTRRFLRTLLLFLSIPAAPVIAQVTNPQYLAQLPSWERIKAQVKGSDAMDTAARQMGACWQLRQVVYDLAWATRPAGVLANIGSMELLGNKGIALTANRSAIKLSPNNVKILSDAAFGFSVFGNTAEALQTYRSIISANPTTEELAMAHCGIGDVYSQLKDYTNASVSYKESIKTMPTAACTASLGDLYLNLKQYPQALAAFREAVRLKPDSYIYHLRLGRTYARINNQLGKAIDSMREAARLAGKSSPEPNIELGNIYFRLDQYPLALTAYTEAIRISASSAEAHHGLGLAYRAMHNKPAALKEYETLKSLDPKLAADLLQQINTMR